MPGALSAVAGQGPRSHQGKLEENIMNNRVTLIGTV
jgi:hypothetical protein